MDEARPTSAGGRAVSDAPIDRGNGGAGSGGSAPGRGGSGGIGGNAAGSAGSGGTGGTETGGSGGAAGTSTGGASGGGGSAGAAGGPTCLPSCFPLPGGQYCGRIGDGCGRILECGQCSNPEFVCGGSGVPSVCGAGPEGGSCTRPTVCSAPGGQYCDVVGDGCGGDLDCGWCPNGMVCGARGVAHLCGFVPDAGLCQPVICAPVGGNYCGTIGDGCGGALDCGSCSSGQLCGARRPNICGLPCPLCPLVPVCTGTTFTTISGTVSTGALVNADPVAGARVYIPNIAPGATLPPIPDGPSCLQCPGVFDSEEIAAALTGPDGKFVLFGVPAGKGIPVVIEIGKWRRQITVEVAPCVENVLPAGTARLPRNRGEGDIPLTAIATGNADRVQCVLRKMGVDDAEFTNPTGEGRIHLYRANGSRIDADTPDAAVLEGTSPGGGAWSRYSQILFPSEGAEFAKSSAVLGNFVDYANRGGRVLASRFSYTWLATNAPFSGVGNWTTGAASPPAPLAVSVLASTVAGQNFATWLGLVGALSSNNPFQVAIAEPGGNLGTMTQAGGGVVWLRSDVPATTQLVSLDLPSSFPNPPCGRVAYSDFHAPPAVISTSTFPMECDASPLTPVEKILEYMILDLSGCRPMIIEQPPRAADPPPPPREPPPPRRPPPPSPPPFNVR